MRVSLGRRGDYGVRAMLALASLAPEGRPVSVREIRERMAIPVRFLPHVMTDLTRAGLVAGVTGRRGGYRLARPASEIHVLDVVDAVEPSLRRSAACSAAVPAAPTVGAASMTSSTRPPRRCVPSCVARASRSSARSIADG